MKIIVAVSGGVDSVVLLDLLAKKKLAKFLGRKLPKIEILGVAHFNHRIHREADAQQQFVKQLAAKYRLPFFTKTSSRKIKSEAEARAARYEFLEKLWQKEKADTIALAHHGDDQVETIFLNLIRGSGLAGATGMTELAGKKWRPFLEIPKAQIEAYAKKAKLKFVVDPTNSDPNFARNYLRAEILPRMRQLNPRLDEGIRRFAKIARENLELTNLLAAEFLRRTENAQTIPLLEFGVLPPAVAKAVVREIYLKEIGNLQKIEERHVAEVLALARNSAGGKQKKFGELTFRTAKLAGQRVLSWK
ncbi:MAG: tRNA lysidine(34) synthetase TilS [Patescibacteria group bacterium]